MKQQTGRVLGYCRVSTEMQVREGESLGEQRKEIERYCKANGLALLEIIEDAGVTGRDFRDRPGILEIQKLAGQKGIDKIVAKDMSRLGRSARELLNSMAYLEDECGVQVVLLKERLDTSTPAGKLMRVVLAGVAEFESDMIRERTTTGRLARQAKGIPTSIGSGGLYGYDYVKGDEQGNGRTFKMNPGEAGVLRQVVGWILDEGLSLRRCAARMHELGFKTRRGNTRWTADSLRGILKHPLLYGDWVERYSYEECRSPRTGKVYKRRTELPRSEWKRILLIMTESVVTRATFDRLQEQLADVHKFKARKDTVTPLLSGLLLCGSCFREEEPKDGPQFGPRRAEVREMARLTKTQGPLKRDGTRYEPSYACYWSIQKQDAKDADRKPCTGPRIPAAEVEKIVWKFAKRCILSPDVFIEKLLQPDTLEDLRIKLAFEVQRLERLLNKIDGNQSKLVERLAEVNSPRLTQQSLRDNEKKRERLEEQRADSQAKLAEVETALAKFEAWKRGPGSRRNRAANRKAVERTEKRMMRAASLKIGRAMDKASIDEKRRIIRAVVGGGKLVVTRVPGLVVPRIKARPKDYRDEDYQERRRSGMFTSPLTQNRLTLGDEVRVLKDGRFKDGVKPRSGRSKGFVSGPDGWRVCLIGTLDYAYVLNKLVEIGKKYTPTAYPDWYVWSR